MEDLTIQLPGAESEPAAQVGGARVPAIILYDGDEIGGLHSLTKGDTVIGRTAGCDIVIPESRVSRRHAIIRRMTEGEDRFEVGDLGSTNGTFVDGDRVGRLMLVRGSKVAIGGRILKFEMLDKTDLAYQSRIVQMIHLDELPGLLTKRSLFRALEMELIRTERYHHPLSVLMMDLDHFKQVNDTHGHLVGSHCLSEVGALIREATRVTDVSGRYGGEEFVVAMPETRVANAAEVAERIRSSIARHDFLVYNVKTKVTVSQGITVFGGEVAAQTEPINVKALAAELIREADEAMYRAKEEGRNRVCLHKDIKRP